MLRGADKWLLPYILRGSPACQPKHVLLCVCDHFEPFHDADRETALARVDSWVKGFDELTRAYRDADGTSPAHTFFYPIEQTDPEILGKLRTICEGMHAEVEVHLHHDGDTPETLRETLNRGTAQLSRYGFLSRHPDGRPAFAFIHGDWALDNSHPQGTHCGVNNELEVLANAGCYADLTMPSAPHPTQTRTINSVYYAQDTPAPKSHDRGIPLQAGTPTPPSSLLLIQGPLGLNWRRRKWGVAPRLENAELSGANPPSLERFRLWLELAPRVRGREDVSVVKLHTHGGLERNMGALFGAPAAAFHGSLSTNFAPPRGPRLHYVTARELVNILHGLEREPSADPGTLRETGFPAPDCKAT